MSKSDDVKIVQISTVFVNHSPANSNGRVYAYGLGDDQNMYVWDFSHHIWRLFDS